MTITVVLSHMHTFAADPWEASVKSSDNVSFSLAPAAQKPVDKPPAARPRGHGAPRLSIAI